MKKYFILAAAAAMFAACSNNDDLAQNEITTERIPLTIGTSFDNLSATTTMRGNFDDVQDDEILNATPANTIGLFIIKKDGKTSTDTDFEVFNLSSSGLTSDSPTTKYTSITPSGSAGIHYPDAKAQAIDIYAYAPYKAGTITDITADKIAINTEIDQTDKDKYMASDVLWGCAGNGTYVTTAKGTDGTSGAYGLLSKASNANNNEISANTYKTAMNGSTPGVTNAFYLQTTPSKQADVWVPMLHRGCKIIVNLFTDGMTYTKLQNAVIKFKVDHKEGELNISDGTYSVKDAAPADYDAAPWITLTSHLGIDAQGATPTEEGHITSPKDGYKCSAVIIPQTITKANDSGNGNIIQVELKSSTESSATTTATYAWHTGDTTPQEFVAGKVYTYNITVKASGLTVTTTVADWVDGFSGTPKSGDATLQ